MSLPSIIGSWNTTPISLFTDGSETSLPKTVTSPESGGRREQITEMVVDFPAPFGPRKAKNDPSGTSNEIPLTASKSP